MKKVKLNKKKSKTQKPIEDPEVYIPQKIKITDPVLMAKTLVCHDGNEHSAAESLGITVKTLRKHIKNNEILSDVKDHILARQIGFAEEQLMSLIKCKDFQSIKFFLESKGKDYGWGKNATQEGSTNKTGVLLINNMTVNNANLNPDDWSKVVLQGRENQKEQLDKKALELGIGVEDDFND